jgi:hypothetical protein
MTETPPYRLTHLSNFPEHSESKAELLKIYFRSLRDDPLVTILKQVPGIKAKIIEVDHSPIFYLKQDHILSEIIQERKTVSFLLHIQGATYFAHSKGFLVAGELRYLCEEEEAKARQAFSEKYSSFDSDHAAEEEKLYCFVKMDVKSIRAF